jgi:hypothetical protein
MSPEEFKAKMEAIRNNDFYDSEVAHGDIDNLMAEVLESLGYGEGLAVIEGMTLWYA